MTLVKAQMGKANQKIEAATQRQPVSGIKATVGRMLKFRESI